MIFEELYLGMYRKFLKRFLDILLSGCALLVLSPVLLVTALLGPKPGLICNAALTLLVSALAGREHVLAAYKEAVEQEYRFFSFGDAMFIH